MLLLQGYFIVWTPSFSCGLEPSEIGYGWGLENLPKAGLPKAGDRIKAGGLAIGEPKICEDIFTQTLSIYFQIFR